MVPLPKWDPDAKAYEWTAAQTRKEIAAARVATEEWERIYKAEPNRYTAAEITRSKRTVERLEKKLLWLYERVPSARILLDVAQKFSETKDHFGRPMMVGYPHSVELEFCTTECGGCGDVPGGCNHACNEHDGMNGPCLREGCSCKAFVDVPHEDAAS